MTDYQMDILIARILRGGVSLSAATVLAGGVWYLADSGGSPARLQPFPAGPWHRPAAGPARARSSHPLRIC